ncbi:hypothetical protein FNV43_RR07814 [Rhamnella rubrinervis]|uniref:Homer protein n=1 Tax=Rhamnella rubrinervis TaxID=2594499 RepID=A0A8K0MN26_9ROSA|nr:hypothetical protein FNV43_RR07814 [Rhamnella rubrinervis]
MVEHQSCASLVNASALCAIEQEVKGETVSGAIAEISAELQQERQKNAELMERISILETQIRQRDTEFFSRNHQQDNCATQMEITSFKKFKRQKIEKTSINDTDENGSIMIKSETQKTHDSQFLAWKDSTLENGLLVNWMSMDETQFLLCEKAKDGEYSTADCDDSDDSDIDDEDDDCHEEDAADNNRQKEGEAHESSATVSVLKVGVHSSSSAQTEQTFPHLNQERNKESPETYPLYERMETRNQQSKDVRNVGNHKAQLIGNLNLGKDTCKTGCGGSISQHKKPPKVAFCPREVKRIIELEALREKNAQSHTIRKIIVFASLGIRHGCEDIYDLDFNHFSILRKGEPYVSPTNLGEHVLYENPGVRRKVFYPNRQNPTLCPVQILEEEKAMRPSDASCPSCFFLCIKYGGRTRNLPQNEYVRQRMGRNKLKSFGPLMCQMAMLVHIRSGSFFFKALGITLLFMAGFPDDLVQRETKYRNLDLLQKYYRTDEDAEGEELFLPYAMKSDTANPSTQQFTGKTSSKRSKGKNRPNSISKSHNIQRSSSLQQSTPSNSEPPHQFGLMGYTAIHAHAMAAFQSQSQTPSEVQPISNTVISNSGTNMVSYPNQTPYQMLPPQPANSFMPLMYWPPPNSYPPGPFTPTYGGYRSFHSTGNYISIPPQPYYSHPSCGPCIPRMEEEGPGKNNMALEEDDTDSDSSSSSTEPKQDN